MKNKAIGKMKYLQQVLLMMLVWFIPFGAMAQSYSLKGTVVDNKGITIPGVNILIKGTTNGVATDIDGNFELIVDKGNVLVVSFTGYKTQEVPVTGQNNLKITLLEDIEQLEEVVVIGYGTLKKVI